MKGQVTMAGLASKVSVTQSTEFFSRFGRFGGNEAKLTELLGNDSLMERWVKYLDEQPEFRPVRRLFISAEEQLACVYHLNRVRGWGFVESDFTQARENIPAWPEGLLVALVLVPYLRPLLMGGMGYISGIEETFQQLWLIAAANHHTKWRWYGYDKAGPDRLRLLDGITHVPGLRWEVIDLGANRGKQSIDVSSPETSPNAGVLAAAMLHPGWVKAMDGISVPFVFIPGYEVNVPGSSEWSDVPGLYFGRDAGEVRLDYYWNTHHQSDWSAPVILPTSRK